jgi:TRAP-type C4-dicarboxylate transport system substrate-binding protein
MTVRALVVAATLLASTVAAASAGAAEVTLRFASISAADTGLYKDVFLPATQAIEADSGNRIKVDLRGLGEFGKPAELFGMVEKGDIEIANTVQGYLPGRFPQTTVVELPMLYDSAVDGTRAMWKMYEEGLFDKDDASVKVLALYVLSPYGIFSAKNVATLKDLRGLRIRTPSPTVGLALIRLGAIPVGLPVNLVGESMAGGVIDAMAFGWDTVLSTPGVGDKKLGDQVKYLADMRFAAPALMIVMNKAAYERLPADLKAAIDKHTGGPLSMALAAARDKQDGAALAKIKADGVHVVIEPTADQRTEMARLISPAINDWAASMKKQGYDGDKLLERARALIKDRQAAN